MNDLERPLVDAMEWMDVLYSHLDDHWKATFRESYGAAIEHLSRDLERRKTLEPQ